MTKIGSFILAGILALGIGGCSSTSDFKSHDVPPQIIEFAHDNVWKIETERGSGSGFAISEDTVITACHVVKNADEVILYNMRDTRLVMVDVKSCDQETDIAVLKWQSGDKLNSDFTGFHPVPKMGKAVWGAGFGLGSDLLVTQGHMGQADTMHDGLKGRWYITAPTVMGDSGSPAIALFNGIPKVIGVRVAGRNARVGWTGQMLVTHMILITPTKDILAEIHKDVEDY